MTPRLEALAEAWLSGALDEAGARELRHAAEDPAVAAWLREQAVIDQGLRRVAGSDTDLRAAVLARLSARGKSQAMRAAVLLRLRQRRRRSARAFLAAALVLVAILLGWLALPGGRSEVRVVALQGDGHGNGRGLAVGMALPTSAAIDTAPSAAVTLRFSDGSEATLAGAARLRDDAGGIGLVLDHGRVSCAVRPRAGRPPFVVSSRFGEAVVVGTRFTVEVGDDAGRLAVDEGVVRLDAAGVSTPVGAGSSLRFAATGFIQGEVPTVALPAPDEWLPPAEIRALSPMPRLPTWNGRVEAAAPAIAAWNGSARAAQGIVLTGARFGAAPVAWLWTAVPGGGRYDHVLPQVVQDDALALRLPGDLPDGVHLLWLATEAGVSAPVRLNAPQARWLTGPGGRMEPGSVVRVVGRDLGGVSAWLRSGTGSWRTIPVGAARAQDLTLTLPSDVAVGDAQILLHQGSAGLLGWSHPLTVTVTAPMRRSAREETIAPGGGDDTTRMQEAVDRLMGQGGGTLRLAAGEFHLSGMLRLGTAVGVVGAGIDRTRVRLEPNSDLRQALAVVGDHVAITDLHLHGGAAHGRYAYGVIGMDDARPVSDVRIERVRIDGEPTTRFEHIRFDAQGTVLHDCDLAVQVRLGGDDAWVVGNRLRGGPLDTVTSALSFGGRRLVLEDNHIASDWPRRADGSAVSIAEARAVQPARPWCPQAFEVDQHYGPVEQLLLRNNRIADIGIDREPRSVLQFQTSGGSTWVGTVTGSDGLTVRLRPGTPPPARFAYGTIDGLASLVVVDGPGRGQARTIVTRSGDSITVAAPWRVPPGPGALVTVSYQVRDVVLVDNDIAGPPAGAVREPFVGIDLAGGSWDVLLTGNTVRTPIGRRLRGTATLPSAWIEVRDVLIGEGAVMMEAQPGPDLPSPSVFGVSGAEASSDHLGPNSR